VKPKRQPRLLIGSSAEAIEIVNEMQCILQYDIEVTPWPALFEPSDATLQKLCATATAFDFAAFVFASDDVARIRKERYAIVRDNVLFELGLFMGALGQKRVFIVRPRGVTDFHLPTDLLGITPTTYDPKRSDRDLRAALNPACQDIRRAMRRLGAVRRERRASRKTFQTLIINLIGEGMRVNRVAIPKTRRPPTSARTTTRRKIRIRAKK
jgi:predicted nucleotide-binding protein